ncbi:MAG TPA: DUF4105 domain-containing protein [Puia sp.]|nr:DUF4105 domain-containing protein [Puia sp.]
MFLIAPGARAGSVRLSPNSAVSILTCDPGTQPYAIFGHNAIRIQDSSIDLDVVFNFGTFNFEDPHFYSKFIGGDLNYYLSTTSFEEFLEEYEEDHRTVWEQVLNMNLDEKQLLTDRLFENAREQNKYYKYNFFFDNCSTRIRDDVEGIFPNHLQLTDSFPGENKTFRQWITKYFAFNPWAGFGINICLGLPADKHASREEQMFLPSNLHDAMGHFLVTHDRKLVSAEKLYDFNQPADNKAYNKGPAIQHHNNLSSPVPFFWLIFVLYGLLAAWEWRSGKRSMIPDFILFSSTGLVGLFLLYLWLGTHHSVAKFNLNLIWSCPLNLLAIFSPAGLRKYYFSFYSVLLSLFLVFFLLFTKYFDWAILPLILTLLIRSVGLPNDHPAIIFSPAVTDN